jgi:pyruvate/2-oxoglutarate dehydrogenase complex dihydrolipoamide acyltransferase (E2) component
MKYGLVLWVCLCRQPFRRFREFPAVNAEIDGTDIIYKNYYNIGVAVGTPQGLVVPVIKDAGEMSLADTERAISDFGLRARDGKIAPDDMAGGTFHHFEWRCLRVNDVNADFEPAAKRYSWHA